jgi:AraC family transcriptional regulator, regulatory protein of adaptative response / methylated-DNA-[protein]-cysteine methyltransferase
VGSTTFDYKQMSEDYRRIEQAILFLEANAERQPSLKEVAESIHLSEYHFQRLFTRWAGISPKKFLQYLTKENAKSMLERSASLLDAAYASGLSGPGRLHDLFVTCEAVTPGEYKARGAGLTIRYGFHPTPFGDCLLAITHRGLCSLSFVSNGDQYSAFKSLKAGFPAADFKEDLQATLPYIQRIFSSSAGDDSIPLHLHLLGTNFQIKVWEALLHIPQGQAVTYGDIATMIGEPAASRAVGRAVGSNPIAVLIPCHRVLRKLGSFGDYRYGTARKKALLGWELAHVN